MVEKMGKQDDPASKVVGFRYLEKFGPLFASLHSCGTEGDLAGNRRLYYDHYASLILLYFFSPTLTSLRGLQEITASVKVQQATGCTKTSLGSLSEAAGVFDAELLRPILADLAEKAVPVLTGKEAEALRGLTAVDGTFFQCLPRMLWALWRDGHKGVKAHVHFDVLKGVPEDATVTVAASSEIEQLERTLKANRLYVVDRGYACYRLFALILKAGSSFLGRVKDNVAYEVQQERPPTAAARQAGVLRDVVVKRLGTDHHKDELNRPVRLVWVQTGKTDKEGKPEVLVLCTDRLDLEAELVALGYKFRWWVELFFRWLKCILGCRHLISNQPDGVAIQIYLALIASVLVSLWTGHRPTKRLYEWLCFYFQGIVSAEELDRFLHDLNKPKAKRKPRFGNTS
jgi:Transposase DDE domain